MTTKMPVRKRTLSPILLAVILMVAGSVSMVSVGIVTVILSGVPLPNDPQQYLVTHPWPGLVAGMFAQALVGFFGYRFLVRHREHRAPEELQGPSAFREFFVGSLVGVAFIGIVMLTLSLVGAYRVSSFSINTGILVGLSLGIGAAFLEEAVFRGFLLRALHNKYGAVVALLIVSVVFGLIHLLNSTATGDVNLWGVVAIMIESGFFLSGAYYLTRRLWLVIGIHLMWNFTIGGIFGLPVSGINPGGGLLSGQLSGPEWLTGGNFGIEGSVVTVIVGLVFGIVMLIVAHRRNGLVLG